MKIWRWAHATSVNLQISNHPISNLGQGLIQVGQDVVQRLDADREPDKVGRDAGRVLLLLAQLLVRRRGGMDGQAARVANVGQVAEQLQVLDKRAPGLDARRRTPKPTRPLAPWGR